MPVNPVDLWNHVTGDKSWVLFAHGTCVILDVSEGDLSQQATELMKEWGPVEAGTSSGDFNIFEADHYPGWLVTCHHPGIVTYVGADEFTESSPPDIMIGLLGRSKRDQDADELEISHIEDKRSGGKN